MMLKQALFLLLFILSFSEMCASSPSITAKIEYLHEFKDFDHGCIFRLTDKSRWARDWYNGPAYYPTIGQTVTLTPMSPEEALDHTMPPYTKPYWLSIHPAPGMAALTIVYVAYKLSD